MSIEYEVKTLDGVAEDVKSLYVESKTKSGETCYRLDVTGVKPVDEFSVVNNTMVKERDRANALEKQLKAYGENTPDTIQALQDKVAALEASGKGADEATLKRIEEVKSNYQADVLRQKDAYEKQLTDARKELDLYKTENMNMRRKQALKEAYSEKGEPSMFDAFCDYAAGKLEWNEEHKEFRTPDNIYNITEWLNNEVYTKHAGFLKENVSAGAKQTRYSGSGYDKFFDTHSADYNLDKQAELFRKDPVAARELLKKYPR